MWLPSPLVMACSILIRGSMSFFRYFLLSNLVQKVILEKSLQILILGLTVLHLFTKFYQNYSCSLGVKAFFTQKIVKCQFFYKKPCQIKCFSLITMKIRQHYSKAGHTHSKNLNALQLKTKIFLGPLPSVSHFNPSSWVIFLRLRGSFLFHHPVLVCLLFHPHIILSRYSAILMFSVPLFCRLFFNIPPSWRKYSAPFLYKKMAIHIGHYFCNVRYRDFYLFLGNSDIRLTSWRRLVLL